MNIRVRDWGTKLKGKRFRSKHGLWISIADPAVAGMRKVKFGQVVAFDTAPDAETIRSNVEAGRVALKRATEALITPGVSLRLDAGIPRFKADHNEPGALIRELNGTAERGRLVNGTFIPVV